MSDPIADVSLKLDRVMAMQAAQGSQMAATAEATALILEALRGEDGVTSLLRTLQDSVALILAAAGTEGGHALRDLLERIRALLAQQGDDLSLIRAALDRPAATVPGAAINGGRPAIRTGAGPAGHG